jgi:integrase/recombinase XerD
VKAFLGDLRLLASYLPADRPLGNISTTDLNNFLEWMQHVRRVPCSPKTLSRRITALKAFFRWLHTHGVIPVDPAERVVQKSVISPLPEILSTEEIEAVLEKARAHLHSENPDTRYYTLVALLLSTGIKKGECLAISPNHIDLEAPGGPLLFIRYANPQQRYKERKIALPQEWVEAYALYQAQYTLEDRLFPWSQRRLEYLLEDLGKEAELNKHLSFDMCRWTCAVTDWLSDIERDKIRQKLGVSRVQWREVSLKLEQLAR